MKLAVDAWNLADDRRGMGRYVRRILNDWRTEDDLEITLIVRKPAHQELLAHEFAYDVQIGAGGRFDAVWYPFSSIRFEVPDAPSTVTFHDAFMFTHPHRDFIARWREQAPIRRTVERATKRATNSLFTAQEFARIFKRDVADFTVVHAVADPFWQPVETQAASPYVLVVAGPDERKNIPTLVRAFARAFSQRSDVTLVVAGNVSSKDAWMLERSEVRYVRVRPSDEELRELYSGAAVVAVPSSAEGFGIMALEAMACGAPVIASNASALPEACDDAAILVPPFDLSAWAFALERLVNDETLRVTMREQSLARVARIDRSAPARLTLELIRRSLENAR